jgi:hypothetical protein
LPLPWQDAPPQALIIWPLATQYPLDNEISKLALHGQI